MNLKRTLAALLTAAGLFAATAAPAEAAVTRASRSIAFDSGSGTMWWNANDCGGSSIIKPGTQASIRENGTTGVTALRIQYLYQIPNGRGGWSNYLQSPTYSSSNFANNATSYSWDGPAYRFGGTAGFAAPDGGRLAVKFTWSRPWPASDTNVVQAVAYCS